MSLISKEDEQDWTHSQAFIWQETVLNTEADIHSDLFEESPICKT